MSVVIINDNAYEGVPGERLVDVARKNGEHFGFLCDGSGVCQLCACQVHQGNEHLNPPTEMEQNWINENMIEDGYRLACQASLRGPGPIEVTSRAEDIRRKWANVYSPPEGTTVSENLNELSNTVGRYVTNQVGRFPMNVMGSVPIFFKNTPRMPNVPRIAADIGRVFQVMLTGNAPKAESEDQQSAPKQLTD
jgi:ferredoxin